MTLSLATAGIAQVYLERILGMGYLDAQLKIQVHFVMLVVTGSIRRRRGPVHLRLLPYAAFRGGRQSAAGLAPGPGNSSGVGTG
jgi:hypothetical protein